MEHQKILFSLTMQDKKYIQSQKVSGLFELLLYLNNQQMTAGI